MTITKEQVLATRPALKEIEVPEWGGTVWIRPMTLGEQGRLGNLGNKFAKADPSVQAKEITARVIMWIVSDENRTPLFTESDLPGLLEQSSTLMFRLQKQIFDLSGLSESARTELEKNSETGQTGKLDS